MDILKKIKFLRFTRVLSSLKYLRRLRSNAALYKKYGIDKKIWQPLSHNAIKKHDQNELPWLDGDVDERTIKQSPHFKEFDGIVQEQLLQWNEKGFMILPGFFDDKEIEEVEQSIEKRLSKKSLRKYYDDRQMNLYRSNDKINKLFRDPDLIKLLSFILGKDIKPFQTINFYKSGSQAAHSDAIHITTEPLGYGVGVWVALEDVVPGSGEFFYYPGSHKLNYIMNEDFLPGHKKVKLDEDLHEKYEHKIAEVIKQKVLVAETFIPKKGDILIWHANMIHGSHPKKDPSLTRKSLVMHYFAQGVLCYHEMLEMPAVFFQ